MLATDASCHDFATLLPIRRFASAAVSPLRCYAFSCHMPVSASHTMLLLIALRYTLYSTFTPMPLPPFRFSTALIAIIRLIRRTCFHAAADDAIYAAFISPCHDADVDYMLCFRCFFYAILRFFAAEYADAAVTLPCFAFFSRSLRHTLPCRC